MDNDIDDKTVELETNVILLAEELKEKSKSIDLV